METINDKHGLIPRLYKQIRCGLWDGHSWKQVSPEYQGMCVYECTKCGKTKVDY